MARGTIPDPMARRHLLDKSLDAKHAIALADAYLEQDRAVEAIAFLVKAAATDRLDELSERAIETGDVFLMKAILEAQGVEHCEPERWERLAEAAEGAGKMLYASLARRNASTIQQD